METMSDSQFDYENKYDDDFYDDESGDDQNHTDSGVEEKHAYRNHRDSPSSSGNDSFIKKTSSSRPPKKTIKLKERTPVRNSDPYKPVRSSEAYLKPNNSSNTSRRAHSDPRGRKPKKTPNGRGAANMNDLNSSMLNRGGPNIVIKRVLSASRNKAKALHNVIYELQQQVEQLTVDNRDLRRSGRIQERELHKLDNTEGELPALIKKHSSEMHVIQEKYKRQKDIALIMTENTKKLESELLKTKDKLKEVQGMVKEKHLGERIDLKNTVANLEKTIEEKDNKIAELNRSIALQKKTHGRTLKEKNEKFEKVTERIKLLEDVQKDLVSRLKDREKALEVTNIYSRRITKDDKSVMSTPRDPVAPILKRCLQEETNIVQLLLQHKSTEEKNEKQIVTTKKTIPTEKEVVPYQGVPDNVSIQPEPHVAKSVREENLKHEDSIDFYDMHDGKDMAMHDGKDMTNINIYDTKDTIKFNPQKDFFITSPNDGVGIVENSHEVEMKENDISMNYSPKQQAHVQMGKPYRSDNTLVYKGKEKADKTDVENDKTNEINYGPVYKGKEKNDKTHVEINKTNERNNAPVYKVNEKVGQTQLEKGVDEMVIGDRHIQKQSPELNEEAKKRKLLLAKIQAIDDGGNPDDVTQSLVNLKGISGEKKSTSKKKPIFLEGTPKSLSNSSEDDTTAAVKSTDSNSNNNNNNNKPNSDIWQSRRNRSFANQKSGNESHSATKKSDRKNSWEFKVTDENMHKGLPAYLDTQQQRQQQQQQQQQSSSNRNGGASWDASSGRGASWDSVDMAPQIGSNVSSGNESDRTDPFSSNKNKTQTKTKTNTSNLNSRFDARYSPTAVEVSLAQDKKSNKRNGFDLFNQFDDPFKDSSKSTKNKDEDTIRFPPINTDTNRNQEIFSEGIKGGRTPDSREDDDIEEMVLT